MLLIGEEWAIGPPTRRVKIQPTLRFLLQSSRVSQGQLKCESSPSHHYATISSFSSFPCVIPCFSATRSCGNAR